MYQFGGFDWQHLDRRARLHLDPPVMFLSPILIHWTPRPGQRTTRQKALLFRQPLLSLREPVQALPVWGGLVCLCLECLVHEIKLRSHAPESSENVSARRVMRAALWRLREGFCRLCSAGAPLKACSVAFGGHFAGSSGVEASHWTQSPLGLLPSNLACAVGDQRGVFPKTTLNGGYPIFSLSGAECEGGLLPAAFRMSPLVIGRFCDSAIRAASLTLNSISAQV